MRLPSREGQRVMPAKGVEGGGGVEKVDERWYGKGVEGVSKKNKGKERKEQRNTKQAEI